MIAPLTPRIARESTRDTARLTVTLSQEVIDNMRNDSSSRIMVFCAAEAIGPYTRDPSDISFPHNVELKCNGDEVKANLRGLKNRPGSTRPVDITSMIRTRPTNYPNSVEMVYALTTKVRYIFIFLVYLSCDPSHIKNHLC
jgi:E3 SUMO-protein ligase PIAS1